MGLTCPSGMTVTITSSATLSQAPSGSSVVSVKVITPVKPGSEGVKVALRLLIFELHTVMIFDRFIFICINTYN